MKKLEEYACDCPLNVAEMKGGKIGVVTASIAYQYAKDAFPEDTSFLKLGLTNPLPIELIRGFAKKVDKLYVIEELDGFMEEQMKAAGIECVGKELIGDMYELNPQILKERLFGEKAASVELDVKPVPRPAGALPGMPPPWLLLYHIPPQERGSGRGHRLLYARSGGAPFRLRQLRVHGRRLYGCHGHGEGL